MSCIQMTSFQPTFVLTNMNQIDSVSSSVKCVAPLRSFSLPRASLKLSPKHIGARSKHRQLTTVCLFGGKGKSDNGNEASPWKALENAMGNLKKDQSVEDVLRQQIEKQEYSDDGGSGGNPPGGSGGDDYSDDYDGDYGESDDESLPEIFRELMQVILATAGFIFLYVYILEGEDITVMTKDIIRYLFGGRKSIRLTRAMDEWRSFFESLRKKEEDDPYWLERAILGTTTWWDGPRKYRHLIRDEYDLEHIVSDVDFRGDDYEHVPSNDDEHVPSDDDKHVPSNDEEHVPSDDEEHVPSDEEHVPSEDDEHVPSDDDERVPSDDDERVPSDDDERVPSDDDERVPSDDERFPSDDDEHVPIDDDERFPSDDDERFPSDDDEHVPRDDDGHVPNDDFQHILSDESD